MFIDISDLYPLGTRSTPSLFMTIKMSPDIAKFPGHQNYLWLKTAVWKLCSFFCSLPAPCPAALWGNMAPCPLEFKLTGGRVRCLV